ncbi:MAG: hypothetical protein RJB01_1070 [Actinomycetota bacterium]
MVRAGALAACTLSAHTAYNLRHLVSLASDGQQVSEKVSILIPARNEERTIRATLADALAQQGLENFEVIALDDGSTDETSHILESVHDPRFTVITSRDEPPPPDWLGKPWACHRLSQQATGSVLVFLDADVRINPRAVASAVQLLRERCLAMVAPYPCIEAPTPLQKLVQPLMVWSWLATVPLKVAERTQWSSFSAANGQFLIFDTNAYQRMGGHEAVRSQVLEDINLMRAVRQGGDSALTVDAHAVATCEMYTTDSEMVDGYTKSLWSAFGGPIGSVVTNAALLGIYVAPIAGLLSRDPRTRSWALLAYAAGVTGRELVAQRRGDPCLRHGSLQPLTHPASITAFSSLNALSWWRHLRGTNSWKGRSVVAHSATETGT